MKSVQIIQSFSLKWIQIFSYVRITDITEFLQEILASLDLLSLNSQSLYMVPNCLPTNPSTLLVSNKSCVAATGTILAF